MVYTPANGKKSSGCARALLILIFGVVLVFVLAYLTKEDAPETLAETPAASSPTHEETAPSLLDVPAIAGKRPDEVESVLGPANSKEETKQGPKHCYRDGAVEVVFIGGKADWITVNPASPLPFAKESLARLGIPASDPSFGNENVIRWEPCGDYVSVSLFPDAGRVDYASIKVTTK